MTKSDADWVIARYSKDIKRSTHICRLFCTCVHCPRRVLGECSDVPVTTEQLLTSFNKQSGAEKEWGDKQLKEYKELVRGANDTRRSNEDSQSGGQ